MELTTVTRELGNGNSKEYKRTPDDTYYPADLTDERIERLEDARQDGRAVSVSYRRAGDVETRLCTVGRSMGIDRAEEGKTPLRVAIFQPQGRPYGDPVGSPNIERFNVRL